MAKNNRHNRTPNAPITQSEEPVVDTAVSPEQTGDDTQNDTSALTEPHEIDSIESTEADTNEPSVVRGETTALYHIDEAALIPVIESDQGQATREQEVTDEVPPLEPASTEVTRLAYPATLLPGALVDAYQKMPLAARMAIDRILIYTDVMSPAKSQDPVSGARQQVSLYRAILAILNTPEQFKKNLSVLLLIIDEHKNGAFHEHYVNRFMETVELSTEDRRLYSLLTTAFRILAPIKTRATLIKSVDLKTRIYDDKGFASLNADARERLVAFFSVDN